MATSPKNSTKQRPEAAPSHQTGNRKITVSVLAGAVVQLVGEGLAVGLDYVASGPTQGSATVVVMALLIYFVPEKKQ